MINRNDIDPARRIDNITKPAPALRTRGSRSNKENYPKLSDDVIISLANAYENKRARQVSEWEQLYTQAARRNA